MKALLAIPAALLLAAPAMARQVDPGFSQGVITRGDAYAIRACGDAFGERSDVCYGQRTTGEVFPFSRGVGIEVDRYRTVRVDCEARHVARTTKGEVAAEFCSAAADGSLAPASFLR